MTSATFKKEQNFQIPAGDFTILRIKIDIEEDIEMLENADIYWQAFKKREDEPIITKKGTAEGNIIYVELNPVDTVRLPSNRSLYHELRIIDTVGNPSKLLEGNMLINSTSVRINRNLGHYTVNLEIGSLNPEIEV